jgi:two-component system NarL family sensor kinase
MTISQDVTDRVRTEQELTQLTAQLFRLQDEERRRIARELHDGTAQNLFGISINLAKLKQLSPDKPEARRLIDECVSLSNESLQEIRTLSYLLHPPLLDEAGLVSPLHWYVQGFSKRSGIYVGVVAQPIDRLSQDVELALFRIVQEPLTNVRRHSGSDTASIRLECNAGDIFLEIRDTGHGMLSAKPHEHADDIIEMGVGIPGMQQRLRQLGGNLEMASNSEGTTIKAVVPRTNGASYGANSSGGRS